MHARSDYNAMLQNFKKRRDQHGLGDGWWKPGEGKHRLRMLPPPANQEAAKFKQKAFFVEFGVHYELGEEGSEPITCPKATLGKPCPVCEFVRTLWKTGTEADKGLARKIGVRHRAASNIILLNEPSKVWIWSYPKTTRDQIEEILFANEDTPAMIDDPDAGYNMTLIVTSRQTPEGVFPQQQITPELKPCAVPDKSVLNKLTNIADLIGARVKSYDEIRSVLLGSATEEAPAGVAAPKVSGQPVPAAPEEEEIIEEIPTAAAPAPPAAKTSSMDVIAMAKAALARRQTQG